MSKLLLRLLVNALALIVVALIVPGFQLDSTFAAIVAALVLGLVNATIRPILLLLTLPINILTLGLFTLVINALMLLLVSYVVKGFTINSFAAAFLGGLLLWVMSWLTNSLFEKPTLPNN